LAYLILKDLSSINSLESLRNYLLSASPAQNLTRTFNYTQMDSAT